MIARKEKLVKECPNCGNICPSEDNYCDVCGTALSQEKPQNVDNIDKQNETPNWAKAIVVFFVITILFLATYFLGGERFQHWPNQSNMTEQETTLIQAAVSPTSPVKTTETGESEVSHSVEVTTNPTLNVYYPGSADMLPTVKTGYVYCTDEDIQDYVKMRYGPSKQLYDVVKTMPNNTGVVVLSNDVKGWTLVYCQGEEGWCRTDFVFPDELGVNNDLMNEYNNWKLR